MKNLIILILLFLITSCVEFPCEQKNTTMIKPSIFNAVNFSPDFNRESKFFDASLQRKKDLLSDANNYARLAFFFKPDSMPAGVPVATLTMVDGSGGTTAKTSDYSIALTDGYIYFFGIAGMTLGPTYPFECYFYLKITGYNDILFSERCKYYPAEVITGYKSAISENIVMVTAYNNDFTHGYVNSIYQTCGFFQISELNNKVFGVDKVEYSYSYGRKKILNAENHIKTRITFCNLSMYQQNLLKTLCNCENLTINGIGYYLVSDFTEIDKNEENEICSLRADFIEIADTTFFGEGATEMPTDLDIKNLFTI